jgi:hypothetical protein
MYPTETRSQFIDLRARGWSYNKIVRHTGISKNTLLRWGQEYQADIERLKHDYLIPDAALEGVNGAPQEDAAQESYFHNLEGFPADSADESKVQNPKSKIASIRGTLRRFLRSPLVQAAIRYAIFRK